MTRGIVVHRPTSHPLGYEHEVESVDGCWCLPLEFSSTGDALTFLEALVASIREAEGLEWDA